MRKIWLTLFVFLFLGATVVQAQGRDVFSAFGFEVIEVEPEDVPEVDSFGDRLLNIREKVQSFLARSDERKAELEELFAARREAQLEKLEALGDDNPRKAELIEKAKKRHEIHLERLEKHYERLGEREEEILERIEQRRDKFEAHKEIVETKKEEREEKWEEVKEKFEQQMEDRKEKMEDKREDFKDRKEMRLENIKKHKEWIEAGKLRPEEREDGIEDDVESKESFEYWEDSEGEGEFEKDDGDEVIHLGPVEIKNVKGVSDKGPINWWLRFGWLLEKLGL